MAGNTGGTDAQGSSNGRLSGIEWRRLVFSVVILLFFGVFFRFGLWVDLVFPVLGWFDAGLELFADEYAAVPPHRIHIFIFSLMLWTVVAGLLVQFWSPRANVAGQWMALLPWLALLLALVLANFLDPLPLIVIFGGLTLLATVLHPAGRDLIRSFDRTRINGVLLVLVVIAAVPLLAFSSTHIGLQTGEIQPAHDHDHGGTAHDHEQAYEEHVEIGHFAGGAAFGFLVIGLGVLASLRPTGWWLPAWFAGLLPAIYGLASITFPAVSSAATLFWAVAAILWGLAFIAMAEATRGEGTRTVFGRRRTSGTRGAGE